MTTVSSPALTRDFFTLTPEELRTGACVLSPEVVSRLGSVLEQHRSILSRDLGLLLTGSVPVDHELWAWCRKSGSTMFVLASVLESVGRQDCLAWLHDDMEKHLMRLHLAIEGALSTGLSSGGADVSGQPQFQQVSTNSHFTIREALESSVGGDLSRFEIIGPESWITWDTTANNLRGRMLTLRYTRGSQTPSLESSTTKVKEVYSPSDNTDVKKLFLQENRTLDTGDAFFKGLSENWSLRKDGGGTKIEGSKFGNSYSDLDEEFSATPVKQVARSEDTQLKGLVELDDDTEPKQLESEQYKTYVKEIYFESPESSPQDTSFISRSNNATPMDSTVHREGQMGLSDSVIVEPRLSTFDMDTFNELCSNTTCKFPISKENIQGQITETKTFVDKNMSQGPLPMCPVHSSSHVNSDTMPRSQPNLPNWSLLNPSTSGPSVAELSHRSDLSPVERKQNNLNCISVSTAASLFQANFRASPLSLAEKPHHGHPEVSHEEGDRSNSDNRILDGGDDEGEDGVDGAPADNGGGAYGYAQMEISDHHTQVKSVLEREAASSAPPIKRQKSHNDCTALDGTFLSGNAGLFTRRAENATIENTGNVTVHEARPELDCEMMHHHQTNSISISQEPSHRLLPPRDNLYRHTPPPPYLVKEPLFQPPPYSSVAQSVSRQVQHTNPSIIQFSSNSQPLFSNPQASRVDKISYTNVPGHLSAPPKLSSQHVQLPSSEHYMPMAMPDTVMAGGGAESSPTSQFVSSHPHNSVMPVSHSVAAMSRNQTFSSNFRQSISIHNTQGAIRGGGIPVNTSMQPRPGRHEAPAMGTIRPQNPPFQPAPLTMPVLRHNALPTTAQQGHGQDGRSLPAPGAVEVDVDAEHYIYPDQAGAVGGAVAQPRQLMRSKISLEDELRELPGWCPDVNGDNIQEIMKEYLHQDGAFIFWRSRRHNKFVITISHQRNLIYLLVRELQPRSRDGGPVYYLFENDGIRTDSILALYRHYSSHGIQMNIKSPQGRQHMEHIYLRGPIRVRITRRRRQ